MKRREFITLLGGSAAAWPLAAHAQQGERVRRVGVLMSQSSETDTGQAALAAFTQGLQQLGWTVGRTLQIDVRWAVGDPNLYRRHAAELVSHTPDVIFAHYAAVGVLRQSSRTIPIVFVLAIDPVGAGDVASLARPRGNATGFLLYEYSISGKWLELLKQIAPAVTRVAVLRDPATAAGIGQFAAIQAVSSPFGVELTPIDARDVGEIEQGVGEFAREPNGGLISTASTVQAIHRKLIIALAARYRLPAVYPFSLMTTDGGLISYGPDTIDPYRRAASYVDRILKGEKPADLPVQAPTKYELVINLATAKALGLEVPPTLLARADEVIE
jgi:putative tryptophan/tyrosine transport system substrate-binding protein